MCDDLVTFVLLYLMLLFSAPCICIFWPTYLGNLSLSLCSRCMLCVKLIDKEHVPHELAHDVLCLLYVSVQWQCIYS